MAPSQNYVLNSVLEPVSRTYQYRKVMKPMLERKRRARINRCLDELKELMTVALQSEGENVAKLEKADILELTVRHLHSLKEKNSLYLKPATPTATAPVTSNTKIDKDSFWQGFRHCANEVSQFLLQFDQKAGTEFYRYVRDYMIPTTTSLLSPQSQQIQNLDTNNNNNNSANKYHYANISIPSAFNSIKHYHHEVFMYRNLSTSYESSTHLNDFNKDNSTMPAKTPTISSSSSDVFIIDDDDDTTVWRPW